MIFPTNQSKRASDNERTNQISSYKSQNLWTSSAKREPSKWKQYQLWILLNLREKCLKFGENRRNVQKIYDSVRKELQDECHCAWSLLKITWTCPIWQPEKMNRTSSGSRLLRLLLVPTVCVACGFRVDERTFEAWLVPSRLYVAHGSARSWFHCLVSNREGLGTSL